MKEVHVETVHLPSPRNASDAQSIYERMLIYEVLHGQYLCKMINHVLICVDLIFLPLS